MHTQPVTVICTYRVKSGSESAFKNLLKRHWPTLRRLGLVTEELPQHYEGKDSGKEPLFFELFTWVDEGKAKLAHEHPEVMAIWEPMHALTEERHGRPSMEFPHVHPLKSETFEKA